MVSYIFEILFNNFFPYLYLNTHRLYFCNILLKNFISIPHSIGLEENKSEDTNWRLRPDIVIFNDIFKGALVLSRRKT